MAKSSIADSTTKIKPFTSDGCSMAPDRPVVPWGKSWAHCCVAHDLTYWRGGTAEERKRSDKELVSCINKVVGQSDTNPSSMGWTYWLGVRMGGAPGTRHPWRWGYGWSSDVLYRNFNVDNKESIMAEIKRIQANLPNIGSELGLDETQKKYIERELMLQIIHFSAPHQIR